MGTSETRVERGRRNGRMAAAKLLWEIRVARVTANVSQRTMARRLGWSHVRYGRFERNATREVSIQNLAAVASLLGLELSAGLHKADDSIRDAGHQALVRRFRALLAPAWQVIAEMPLPGTGDRRSWDLGLRLVAQRVGVEAETAIRDVQRLVRHTRDREADGGMDEVVLLLADTRRNRRLLPELLEALGDRFQTPPRPVLKALREGRPLPGSGVILV
ncbi:MAG: helix-turn-helix transcriptional regulator [Chloroflexota bacterium]